MIAHVPGSVRRLDFVQSTIEHAEHIAHSGALACTRLSRWLLRLLVQVAAIHLSGCSSQAVVNHDLLSFEIDRLRSSFSWVVFRRDVALLVASFGIDGDVGPFDFGVTECDFFARKWITRRISVEAVAGDDDVFE